MRESGAPLLSEVLIFALENLKMYVAGKCNSRAHCASGMVGTDKQLCFKQLSVDISTVRKRCFSGILAEYRRIRGIPWVLVLPGG
jgi:hypothetical protein